MSLIEETFKAYVYSKQHRWQGMGIYLPKRLLENIIAVIDETEPLCAITAEQKEELLKQTEEMIEDVFWDTIKQAREELGL